MENIYIAAAITAAIIEIIKRAIIPEEMNKIIPLISLMAGIFVGHVVFNLRGVDAMYVGIIASGSYETVKSFMHTIRK